MKIVYLYLTKLYLKSFDVLNHSCALKHIYCYSFNNLLHGLFQIRVVDSQTNLVRVIRCLFPNTTLYCPIIPFIIENPSEEEIIIIQRATTYIAEQLNNNVPWIVIQDNCFRLYEWVVAYSDIAIVRDMLIDHNLFKGSIESAMDLLVDPLLKLGSNSTTRNVIEDPLKETWVNSIQPYIPVIISVVAVVTVIGGIIYYVYKKGKKTPPEQGGGSGLALLDSPKSSQQVPSQKSHSSSINKIVNNYLVLTCIGIYIISNLKSVILTLYLINTINHGSILF